jgi:lysine-N-methylase
VRQVSLPVLSLALREQRYSCHGCGNCCRDFTVQLRAQDLRKLREQDWEQRLGGPVTIEFRGVTYLRQRDDGACTFLMENGLCRIHKEFGFQAKPIACQLFPFHLTPTSRGIVGGLNFACQSVLENKGTDLKSHAMELGRMAGALEELQRGATQPPLLTDRLRASKQEEDSLIDHIDAWLRPGGGPDLDLSRRIDGLAWVVQSLAKAKLENVRDERFDDLLAVLFGALPEELEHHPLSPPTSRQKKMLRQAVFARTEDPKLGVIARQGRLRTIFAQLARSRRFKSGRGRAPLVGVGGPAMDGANGEGGWSDQVDLREVEMIHPATDAREVAAIDDLLTRWLRATILGGRAWGAGYYGWSMISGLQALLLNVACVGWLARLHAAGRPSPSPSAGGGTANHADGPRERAGVRVQSASPLPERSQSRRGDEGAKGGLERSGPPSASLDHAPHPPSNPLPQGRGKAITLIDVRAALGRIDRTAGRAKWLASSAERLRLAYLNMDDGLRRLLARYAATSM